MKYFTIFLILAAMMLTSCGGAHISDNDFREFEGQILGTEHRLFETFVERPVFAVTDAHFRFVIEGDHILVTFNILGVSDTVRLRIIDQFNAASDVYSLALMPDEMIRLRSCTYTDTGYHGWAIYHHLP